MSAEAIVMRDGQALPSVAADNTGVAVRLPSSRMIKAWQVECDEQVHFRKTDDPSAVVVEGDSEVAYVDIAVSAVDTSATYTVTVDGTDYDYAAEAGDAEAEILAGLAKALGSRVPDTDQVVAEVNTNEDNLRVAKADEAAFTASDITVSATGSGGLTKTSGPEACDPWIDENDGIVYLAMSGTWSFRCKSGESGTIRFRPLRASNVGTVRS